MKICSAKSVGGWVASTLLVMVTVLLGPASVFAAIVTSAATGYWDDGATWGGSAPAQGDTVIIAGPHTVTVRGVEMRQAPTTINAGATLVISAPKLNLNAVTATLVVDGTLDIQCDGGIEDGGNKKPVVDANGTVRIGTSAPATGTFGWQLDPASTFNYYGAAQPVFDFGQAYGNLILSGSGVKTLPAGLIVLGDLWLQGSASIGGGPLTNPPPASIALSGMTAHGPTISWTDSGSATGYKLYRSLDGFAWTFVDSDTGTPYAFGSGHGTLSNTNYYWTVTATYAAAPTESAKFVTQGRTALGSGWNTIASPYDTNGGGDRTPQSVFGWTANVWKWVSAGLTGGDDIDLGSWQKETTRLTPGAGYMSSMPNETTGLNATDPKSVVALPVTITLVPGWNLISNPTLTNLTGIGASWRVDGDVTTLSAAITAGTIYSGLYWYNTASSSYSTWNMSTGSGSEPTVEPWKGYWIYNSTTANHTLKIQ